MNRVNGLAAWVRVMLVSAFAALAAIVTPTAHVGVAALAAVSVLAVSTASAQITIPTVTIGNAGNVPDPTTGYGAVAYTYNIGRSEVTNAQYAAFLNAKAASDPTGLYNENMAGTFGGISRAGSPGSYTYSAWRPNHPVNFVSFWDAARFANWLHNGQGSGDTENGAYTLTSGGISGNTVTRNAGWRWAVTTENEWCKAAYHQPASAGGDSDDYWLYGTSSNSISFSQANYSNVIGNTTPVATYAANYYGLVDMAGNLSEWNEAVPSAPRRGLRGGSLQLFESWTRATTRSEATATTDRFDFGFRVVALPGAQVCEGAWLDGEAVDFGTNGSVYALAVLPNGDLVAGGAFTSAGVVPASRIARWNGSSWAPLGSGVNSDVYALAAMPNGDVVAGGAFSTAGGVSANRIARWNGSSWAPLGSGTNGDVYALAVMPNGDLIAAGNFTFAGGVAANRIALWNGSSWSPLGSGMNSFLLALTVMPNGDLIAGGDFTDAGGVAANRIARWDGSAWASLGSGMNQYVYRLAALPNGDVVAGGNFTSAGGVLANRIARWNGTSWAPLGSGSNADSPVTAIAVLPNGDLVAGGLFTTAAGAETSYIGRWNGTNWSSLGSGVGGGGVSALAVLPDGDLIAGGFFGSAGGLPNTNIARYKAGSPVSVAIHPVPQTLIEGGTLVLSASPADGVFGVSVQWYRDGVAISNGPGGASGGGGTVSGASGTLASPTMASTAMLTIANAQPSDSGNYTAVFTNNCSVVTSDAASVQITINPCRSTWEQQGSYNGPSARVGYAMAYDAQRGEHVLFGGDNGSGPVGDTWTWNGTSWRMVASTGPSPRAHAVAVFDSARNRVVLFGGRSGNNYHNDTWEWNGSSWTRILTAVSPSQRAVAGMAFDSVRNRAVLFGGNGPSGHLGDLWEYDGSNWLAKPTPPVGAREWPGLAFDSVRGVLVLFGGSPPQASNSFNDTWEWNGVTGVWSLRDSGANGPPGRGNKNLAFDPQRGVTVVLSGYAGVFRADHWEWNGAVWTQRLIAIPEARYSHVLTYDSQRNRVVAFGGEVASAELRDTTWEFDGSRWTPMSGSGPSPRFGAAHVFAPELGGAVTFGGVYAIGPQYFAVSNELWLQSPSGWGLLDTNSITSRAYSSLGAIGNGQLLMFGGLIGATNTPQNELWRFSGTTWTQLNPSNAPSPRSGAASCVFTSIGKFVVFGGQSNGSLVNNHLHVIDAANPQNWTTYGSGTESGYEPSRRDDAMLAYDPVRDEAILFGGRNASRFDLDDIWRLRFVSGSPEWTQMGSLGIIQSWSGGSMFWDPGRQRIMLYAKQQFGFEPGSIGVVPTVYEWTGSAFVPIAGVQPPSLRKYASMGPTSASGDIRLFGGLRLSDSAILGDTWAFNGVAAPSFPIPPSGGGTYQRGVTITIRMPVVVGQSLGLRWARNGVPLNDGPAPSGSTISGAQSSTLIISNAQGTDAGVYTCTAQSPCGSALSASAEVVMVGLACNPADIANTDADPGPDGVVDNGDFTAFFNAFFAPAGSPDQLIADIANTDADPGADGFVDNGDFTAFFANFFIGCN